MHMRIVLFMTKIISLSEDAYRILKRMKMGNESFSDVVIRITRDGGKRSLLESAGKWEGDDIGKIFKEILGERERAASRKVRI